MEQAFSIQKKTNTYRQLIHSDIFHADALSRVLKNKK